MANVEQFVICTLMFGMLNAALYGASLSYGWSQQRQKFFLSGINFFAFVVLTQYENSATDSIWPQCAPPLFFTIFWLIYLKGKPPKGGKKVWKEYFSYVKFLRAERLNLKPSH